MFSIVENTDDELDEGDSIEQREECDSTEQREETVEGLPDEELTEEQLAEMEMMKQMGLPVQFTSGQPKTKTNKVCIDANFLNLPTVRLLIQLLSLSLLQKQTNIEQVNKAPSQSKVEKLSAA